MNSIAFHIASGDAFFSGSLLWLLAIAGQSLDRSWAKRLRIVVAIVGTVLISLSSTAIPLFSLIGFLVIGGVSIFVCSPNTPQKRFAFISWFAISLFIVGYELRFRFPESPQALAGNRLIVIGDSITAGMNEPEAEKWPSLLAAQHQLHVTVLARPGATVSRIMKAVQPFEHQPSLVVLEIGGNDVLQDGSHAKFSHALQLLLEEVSKGGHRLVMVELPLPPFYNRFAATQRSLAARFNVTLIPKRDFLAVLAAAGSTSDSLHLSQRGHQRMAKMVWKRICLAFD
jgi:acyl-CoA thioesterase-1